MKEFIEMLKKIKPNVDFENEEALVDDGIRSHSISSLSFQR